MAYLNWVKVNLALEKIFYCAKTFFFHLYVFFVYYIYYRYKTNYIYYIDQ